MRFSPALLTGLILSLFVAGCSFSPAPRKGYSAIDVSVESAGVRLLRKGMTVCLIRTQLPNVEMWKIINRNTEIVIKSRGEHGPAVVERFHTQTGVLEDRIVASAIQNGQPEWAQGFEDSR
jgi:hypothetical protein